MSPFKEFRLWLKRPYFNFFNSSPTSEAPAVAMVPALAANPNCRA